MRECGEDLLVEMSDVLFNELAFFKLMQDLDDPNVTGKLRQTEWPNPMVGGISHLLVQCLRFRTY